MLSANRTFNPLGENQVSHKRRGYASDVSDEQWLVLKALLIRTGKRGRPMRLDLRAVVNGIFYLLRTGCQWKNLPHEYPNFNSVYYHFHKWSLDGTWMRVNRWLVYQVRHQSGRCPHPAAAVVDSQSVKIADSGGVWGFDGHKQVKGRKRHLLVDTQGNVLAVSVSRANVQDRDGARPLFEQLLSVQCQRLQRVWADRAYDSAQNRSLQGLLLDLGSILLQIVTPPVGVKGFVVLPRRWVVERTFAWLGRYRRLSKDFERLVSSSEAMLWLASIHRLLPHLASA
jgi:putative transposase